MRWIPRLRLLRIARAAASLAVFFCVTRGALAYTLLHHFIPNDGTFPGPVVLDSAGFLYGTTSDGGAYEKGTVFRVRTDGSGYTILRSFDGSDGSDPLGGVVLDDAGNLYGTTISGGAAGEGTVFRMKTDGTGFVTLRNFAGTGLDGGNPRGALVLDGDRLYGTAGGGGSAGLGVVFSITTAGGGFLLLHSFTGGTADGQSPAAGLALDGSAVLYGTTWGGGGSNLGTVFSVRTNGADFALLHSFTGVPDGKMPVGELALWRGMLYGVTQQGGVQDFGSVYRISTSGGSYQVLHSFSGEPDARHPIAGVVIDGSGRLYGTAIGGNRGWGLVYALSESGSGYTVLRHYGDFDDDPCITDAPLVLDGAGNLFGTSHIGGGTDENAGTVFSMRTDGTALAVLKALRGVRSDGKRPRAELLALSSGELLGTTREGGWGFGTLFRLRDDGSQYKYWRIGFGGADPAFPQAALTQGYNGYYGATSAGGASNLGTVFEWVPDTSTTVLHEFTGGVSDGSGCYTSITSDAAGTASWGVTYEGGGAGLGTLFKFDIWGAYSVLHTFVGGVSDGANPAGRLLLSNGWLYGTTYDGGASGQGTVFKIRSDGVGFALVHTFAGGAADGGRPMGGLVLDGFGYLSGTTFQGGPANLGTVFRVQTDGSGFSIVHTFAGAPTDGAGPYTGLAREGTGTLYGTTLAGGTQNRGTVFSISTGGAFTILHSFQGGISDGAYPMGAVVRDSSGTLYGTTSEGGSQDAGVVYSIPSSCRLADTASPAVTAPVPITVDQAVCCGSFGGVTGLSSPVLARFLAGGSAADDCAVPIRLSPRVGGTDVNDATCFAAGATAVTFRYGDEAGNVGTATSTVTVRVFGDLDLDGAVDPSDMVVLRAYLNFAISPGTPPFDAPLGIADLTHDATVDPGDMVMLRAYLNFAVSCLAP